MSTDPKPREAGKQARFLISPASMAHIKRIAKRSRLRQNQVVDQIVGESLRLEREVKKLGYAHVGEALAVLRRDQPAGVLEHLQRARAGLLAAYPVLRHEPLTASHFELQALNDIERTIQSMLALGNEERVDAAVLKAMQEGR